MRIIEPPVDERAPRVDGDDAVGLRRESHPAQVGVVAAERQQRLAGRAIA